MVFHSPSWVPAADFAALPHDVAAGDFVLDRHLALPCDVDVKAPFMCAQTGQTYSAHKLSGRVDEFSRTLRHELQWQDDSASPWDRVVAILSVNSKLAKVTHMNVIAQAVQSTVFERVSKKGRTEVGLGILPLSHIYGIVLSHLMCLRGDCMVLHASFDMQKMLKSISEHRIERLYLVPPIITAMANNPILLEMYDLSSVRSIVTGGGPLTRGLSERMYAVRPDWQILPGYGLTESGGIATFTGALDPLLGSSGCLLPGVEARLVGPSGGEIEDYNVPGELRLRSPLNVQGFLGEPESDHLLFTSDGWLRTGDVGLFSLGPQGSEHLFIVDRIKDMIKVKGTQVAPIEIESCLIRHPAVADAAVIGVEDAQAGERPFAFVVRTNGTDSTLTDAEFKRILGAYVDSNLPETHRLHQRIRISEVIPKSQSGKVLKHVLRASKEA
ncbi:hypothetical protein LTR49_028618 [Elasticomyces elasticus]|nr:hypothetical protein LTR49_028618 [Elasticomyces elasticus]